MKTLAKRFLMAMLMIGALSLGGCIFLDDDCEDRTTECYEGCDRHPSGQHCYAGCERECD